MLVVSNFRLERTYTWKKYLYSQNLVLNNLQKFTERVKTRFFIWALLSHFVLKPLSGQLHYEV